MRGIGLAWRRWQRRRKLAAVAVITIAVALGATVALFSVFHSLVLDPLPYPNSQRLVWLQPVNQPAGTDAGQVHSSPNALDYRAAARTLTPAYYYPNQATVLGRGEPLHVNWTAVTGDFFPVLGVNAELGRALQPHDETAHDIAVISDALWRIHFGADPQIVGKILDLDNTNCTIIGVMPPGFDFPRQSDVWRPEDLAASAHVVSRGLPFLYGIGRLASGATWASAQQEAAAISRRLSGQYPQFDAGLGLKPESFAEHLAGPVRATLGMMLLAGLLVLGIACANVGNLLMADAVERRREMAVRASLGASRTRLLVQLILEAALLAIVAGAAAWAVAAGLLAWVRGLHWTGLDQLARVRLDAAVFAFLAAAVLAATAWFTLAPAWDMLCRGRKRKGLLREASDVAVRSRLPEAVVVAEVAVAAVLLVAAGLLALSLRRLQRVEPGFDPRHLLTGHTTLLWSTPKEFYAKAPFYDHLNQRLPALPGVIAAGMATSLPMAPAQFHYRINSVSAPRPLPQRPVAGGIRVYPGYLAAMRIPVHGRSFSENDGPKTQRVVIVSRALATQLWPGRDALGEALVWGKGAEPWTIIGIAGDVPAAAPGGPPALAVYLPALQTPGDHFAIVLRARGNPFAVLPELRQAMRELDPQVPIFHVASMDQVLAEVTAADRLRAQLLLAMAMLALVLAVAGLYSVLTHNVAQQRRDIGIRMALGASLAEVRSLVLARALRLIVGGAVIGMLTAFWLRPGLRAFLLPGVEGGIAARWIWIGAPIVLLAVGLLASYLPARQATRVDPLDSLRSE